jgi:hypothetical protein
VSIDLSPEELDHMYEASKYDHNPVVGSEVRQMVGMIRRSADRIEALEAALREIARFPCTNKNRAGTQMMKIARDALASEQDK